jgi:hypothetical protein
MLMMCEGRSKLAPESSGRLQDWWLLSMNAEGTEHPSEAGQRLCIQLLAIVELYPWLGLD